MDLYKLFDIRFFGKRIKRHIVNHEGGEQCSLSLREYAHRKNHVSVGLYSYGSVFADDFNVGGSEVNVGRYCSFASDVTYYGANHPLHWFSTSPYFYNKAFGFDVKDVERFSLNIGNDVWIGAGVIITCGCKEIGNGSVIAAGSVVTKDVPAYSVVGGVPAKLIRSRFEEETINLLEESKWYDLSPRELMEFYEYKDEPKLFARSVIDRNIRKQSK